MQHIVCGRSPPSNRGHRDHCRVDLHYSRCRPGSLSAALSRITCVWNGRTGGFRHCYNPCLLSSSSWLGSFDCLVELASPTRKCRAWALHHGAWLRQCREWIAADQATKLSNWFNTAAAAAPMMRTLSTESNRWFGSMPQWQRAKPKRQNRWRRCKLPREEQATSGRQLSPLKVAAPLALGFYPEFTS